MFQPKHLRVFFGGELGTHAVEFFDTHAVFAGDSADHGYAGFQDVGAKYLAAVQLVGVVGIEHDEWVQGLTPDVSQFVVQQIEDTVRRGDAEEITQLIALNIGKDLQYIRINGAVVGDLIGLVLFAVSHAGEIRWAAGESGDFVVLRRPFGLSLSKLVCAGLNSMLGLRAEAGSRPACE